MISTWPQAGVIFIIYESPGQEGSSSLYRVCTHFGCLRGALRGCASPRHPRAPEIRGTSARRERAGDRNPPPRFPKSLETLPTLTPVLALHGPNSSGEGAARGRMDNAESLTGKHAPRQRAGHCFLHSYLFLETKSRSCSYGVIYPGGAVLPTPVAGFRASLAPIHRHTPPRLPPLPRVSPASR